MAHNKGEPGLYVPKGITKVHNGIYCIFNKVSRKVYIGSGTPLITRINWHRNKLRKGIHNNQHLQRAFAKYGEKNFQVIILEIVEDYVKTNKEHNFRLLDRETEMIALFNATDTNYGYNVNKIARGNRGIKLPKERVDKMKERWTEEKRISWGNYLKEMWKNNEVLREYYSNMYSGNGNPFFGKTHNDETKIKIKTARATQPITKRMLTSLELGRGTQAWTEKTWEKLRENNLGELNPSSTLTEEMVVTILSRLQNRKLTGQTQTQIAEEFGIRESQVTRIKKGQRWGHLKTIYPHLYNSLG